MKLIKLVVNASPIISLAKTGFADILLGISSDIVIPEGVYQEITSHRFEDAAVEWIKALDRSLIQRVEIPPEIAEWNLGKGESQVISFAYQHAGFIAVLDDKAARRCAEAFNLKVIGTISAIIKARLNNNVTQILPIITKLRTNGFRISDAIIKEALLITGEDK